MEHMILPEGASKSNEDIKAWRAATAKILSQPTILEQQLALVASDMSEKIRQYAQNLPNLVLRVPPQFHVHALLPVQYNLSNPL